MISFSKKNLFLITGASSGIGKSIAILLNELNASVVAVARNEDQLKKIKSSVKNPENFHIETKDLSKDIENLKQWVINLSKKYGKFQGLVNSAGICEIDAFRTQTFQGIKKTFDLNFFSGIFLAKGIISKQAKMNGQSIIFISSIASIRGNGCVTAYSSSKAAINGLVRSMAKELGRYDIRVNAILPGNTDTNMVKNNPVITEKFLNKARQNTISGKLGKPEQIANLAVFLLSDKSSWITGQNIVIDGGETL